MPNGTKKQYMTNNTDPIMQEALSLLNQNKLSEARTLLDQYLKAHPNDSEGWRLAAQVDLNYYKDADKAYDELIEALRLQPKNLWALVLMGNLLLENKKDSEGALEYFKKVLEFHPDNSVALANIGAVMAKTNNYTDAFIFFSKSLKADPTYANAYYGMGLAYFRMEDYQKAFEFAQDGLHKAKQRPEEPTIYNQLCNLSLQSAQQIVKNTDYSEVRNDIVKELQKNDHLPIKFIRDDNLSVSAQIYYGPIHGKLANEVHYNPAKPFFDHLCIHELMHLKLLQRNTQAAKGKVFAQSDEQSGAFIKRYHAFFVRSNRNIPTDQLKKVEVSVCEGIGLQLLNCPLDMFVEDMIYSDYPQLRPIQLLSLMSQEQAYIKSVSKEVAKVIPPELMKASKCMNLCTSLHFRQLYGINVLNQYAPPSQYDMDTAKDLYEEYLEYTKGFGPGEEYDLVDYFGSTLNLDNYYSLMDQHVFMGEYESKKRQADAAHNDEYADAQNARYALEHQDGANPTETMMMAMYMNVAMDHCDKIGQAATKRLAMEIARLGLSGINPSKKYSLPSISSKMLDGYQVIAFYYVTFARAFPQLLDEIGLPYTKAYEMALKMHEKK